MLVLIKTNGFLFTILPSDALLVLEVHLVALLAHLDEIVRIVLFFCYLELTQISYLVDVLSYDLVLDLVA